MQWKRRENKMKTWNEIETEMGEFQGYVLMLSTDQCVLDTYPVSYKNREYLTQNFEKRVLELRFFNKEKEHRLLRTDVRKEFQVRTTCGDDASQDYYDDEQYLELEFLKRSKQCLVLFEKNKDIKVTIRNYVDYEQGQAYIKDWRLVELFYEEVR